MRSTDEIALPRCHCYPVSSLAGSTGIASLVALRRWEIRYVQCSRNKSVMRILPADDYEELHDGGRVVICGEAGTGRSWAVPRPSDGPATLPTPSVLAIAIYL